MLNKVLVQLSADGRISGDFDIHDRLFCIFLAIFSINICILAKIIFKRKNFEVWFMGLFT